ncbi:elongation of very long chain fatty acids protein, partial [Asbolus verrucosus]
MENRKPFNLRKILIFYNLIQTLFSSWIFYEYLMSGWWGSYSFRCQPVDYSNSPMALRKNSHVSTLHVIHHGCMPFSVWMGMKFAPGGHSTFFALLNSFVHIIMYFYYMVAAMGPQYQKFIWWKKYLTTFQMFQLLFTECNYPKGFMIWIALHGIMFLFLFSDFYKIKYTNSKMAVKNSNSGACMPVFDDEKKENDIVKKSDSNGTLNNTYIKSEYSDSYKACYSNGSTNGFVTQSIIQRNSKKIK